MPGCDVGTVSCTPYFSEICSLTTPVTAYGARMVNWELARGRKYTLSYKLYGPDGTLLSHQTEQKVKISFHDGSSFVWRTYGSGWAEPGRWPTGVYRAEV